MSFNLPCPKEKEKCLTKLSRFEKSFFEESAKIERKRKKEEGEREKIRSAGKKPKKKD